MKKSEVIKLMKEGTHCIYANDISKEKILIDIIECFVLKDKLGFERYSLYRFYWYDITDNYINCGVVEPRLKVIRLSEIEPDNEKPYLFYEGEKYYFGEEYEFSSNEREWVKEKLTAFDYDFKICSFKTPEEWKVFIRKIDHTEKLDIKGVIKRIAEYSPDEIDLMPFDETRKKDHIYCIEWGMQKAKRNEFLVYQKLLSELKEQAEKDGVNLKELI